VLTKPGIIASKWLGTLIEISRIISVNSRYLSDSNWEHEMILRNVLVEIEGLTGVVLEGVQQTPQSCVVYWAL